MVSRRMPLATTLSRVRIVSLVFAPERLLSKARVVTGRKACPQAGSATANIPTRPMSVLRIRLILHAVMRGVQGFSDFTDILRKCQNRSFDHVSHVPHNLQ